MAADLEWASGFRDDEHIQARERSSADEAYDTPTKGTNHQQEDQPTPNASAEMTSGIAARTGSLAKWQVDRHRRDERKGQRHNQSKQPRRAGAI